MRRHLDKEKMGGKVENKALAALMPIVQHLIQLARNLDFVSASATSLETKSAGAREKVFVVLKEQQGRQEGQVERKEMKKEVQVEARKELLEEVEKERTVS